MGNATSVIETGVDKLVSLVNREKRISVPDASKKLGVSVSVVEEWADFLEEEGLISVEYKLATTYLCERKLTKKETLSKAKEFHESKDAFIRNVETSISSLDSETASIGDLKDQFKSLKSEIGGDLENVKSELKELESYERLKKEIDSQLMKRQQEYKSRIGDMEKDLLKERKRYQEIIDDIDIEKVKLQEERSEVLSLRDQEQKLLSKLGDFNDMIKKIRDTINQEEDKIEITEKHIGYLMKTSDKVRQEVEKHKGDIDPLLEESKKHQEIILKKQKDVIDKVMKNRKQIEDSVRESRRVTEGFKKFFERKADIEKQVEKIDSERQMLRKELDMLINKAHAFNIAAKQTDVKKHIKELEDQFRKIENKKQAFRGEISGLIAFIKRNFK